LHDESSSEGDALSLSATKFGRILVKEWSDVEGFDDSTLEFLRDDAFTECFRKENICFDLFPRE